MKSVEYFLQDKLEIIVGYYHAGYGKILAHVNGWKERVTVEVEGFAKSLIGHDWADRKVIENLTPLHSLFQNHTLDKDTIKSFHCVNIAAAEHRRKLALSITWSSNDVVYLVFMDQRGDNYF